LLSRLDGQLPPLPESIAHAAYLPLDVLLPRVSAFVHHGGIGTAALALRAGVPQVMLPTFSNQYDNARRVAALGCGVTLEGARDAEAIAAAIRHVASPEVIARCAGVQRLTEPGEAACRRAADLVEQTVDANRTPAARAA
jgi:rhamnosyltransferase subunit B